MSIRGPGKILSIEPHSSDDRYTGGSLVTGLFVHLAKKTLDLQLEGDERPIGVTPNHPIWSVDRSSFVEAGTLAPGERLRAADGSTRRVASITARGPPEPVFNLEVDAEHVFYVGDDWVLVHNSCAGQRWLHNGKRKNEVYVIRDSAGNVEYVGITKTHRQRQAAHRRARNDQSITLGLFQDRLTRNEARAV